MTSVAASRPKRTPILLPATAILLMAVVLRMVNIMNLPLFVDEVFHVWRAQKIATGAVFTGLDHNKWLYTALLSLFNPRTGEALFMGRALTVILSTLTLSLSIALGKLLWSPKIGLLAGSFYVLLPLAVFHERQALVDGTLALFAMLIVVLSVRLAKRPRILYAFLLALALAGAYLAKATGILFFVVPFVAIVLFTPRSRWLKTIGYVLPGIASGLFTRSLLVAAATTRVGISPRETHSLNASNLLVSQGTMTEALTTTLYDLTVVGSLLLTYVGFPLLLIIIAALLVSFRNRQWRVLFYLAVPAILLWLPLVIVDRPHGGDFPARYLVAHVPMLVVLGAAGLHTLYINIKPSQVTRFATVFIVLVTSIWWLSVDLWLIINPASAPLHRVERRLYFSNDPDAAYAAQADSRAIGEALGATLSRDGVQHYLSHSGNVPQFEVYAGPYRANGQIVAHPGEQQEREVRQWVASGETIYILEQEGFSTPRTLDRMNLIRSFALEEVTQFGPNQQVGTYNLYKVVSFDSDFTERLLGQQTPPWGAARGEVTPLLSSLTEQDRVYVHPAHFAEAIAMETDATVIAATDGRWPVTDTDFSQAIEESSSILHLLLVDEAITDPARTLLTTGLDAFFIGEQWSGRAHLVSYLATPDLSSSTNTNARFEGGIELETIAITTSTAPGAHIPIQTNWMTQNQIGDSFAIFTHLVAPDDTLIAQIDGIPGNGLRPMPEWAPGNSITDRYALRVPEDTALGTYTIRVGIYNPANGLRLPVIQAPDNGLEHGGDYVTLTQVTIESAAGNQTN